MAMKLAMTVSVKAMDSQRWIYRTHLFKFTEDLLEYVPKRIGAATSAHEPDRKRPRSERPIYALTVLIPRGERAAGAVVGGAEEARRRHQNRIGRGRRRSLHHLVAARLERAHEIE
jgi:hypothetical protein